MTCKEKLIADHPNLTDEEIQDILEEACPDNYDYMDAPLETVRDILFAKVISAKPAGTEKSLTILRRKI